MVSQEEIGRFESENFRLNGELEGYQTLKSHFETMQNEMESKVEKLM